MKDQNFQKISHKAGDSQPLGYKETARARYVLKQIHAPADAIAALGLDTTTLRADRERLIADRDGTKPRTIPVRF